MLRWTHQSSKQYFFDIRGILHIDWCQKVKLSTQNTTKIFSIPYWKGKKRTPFVDKPSWIIQWENTLVHNSVSLKTFLAKHTWIPVVDHPLYPTYLIPCDTFYSQKLRQLWEEYISSKVQLSWIATRLGLQNNLNDEFKRNLQ